jgi:hypothetical protein
MSASAASSSWPGASLALGVGLAAGVVLADPADDPASPLGLHRRGLGLASAIRPPWLPREEIPRLEFGRDQAQPLALGEGFRLSTDGPDVRRVDRPPAT